MTRLRQRAWQACGVVLLGSMASCQTLIGLDELERANGGADGIAGSGVEEAGDRGGTPGPAERVTDAEGERGGSGTDGAGIDGQGGWRASSGGSGRGGGSGNDEEGGSAGSSGGVGSNAAGSPESGGDWWGTGGQGGEGGWNWGGTGNTGVAGTGRHGAEIGGLVGEAGEGSELAGYGGRDTAGGGRSGPDEAGAADISAGSGGAAGTDAGIGGTGSGGQPTGGAGSGGVLCAGGSGGSAAGGEGGTSAMGGTATGTGGQCSETQCGAECVDLMEDFFHCGACNRECEADGVSEWRCGEGVCTSTCLTGRGNCWQPRAPQPDDGCETNTLNDVLNCGECGRACVPTGGVDQARCDAGVCTSMCLPGYVNVNRPGAPLPDDGCELNTMTDVNNCGAVGRACSGTGVSALRCEGGKCTSTCQAGYLNLSRPDGATVDDGCELDTWTDANNCGVSGRVCDRTHVSGVVSRENPTRWIRNHS